MQSQNEIDRKQPNKKSYTFPVFQAVAMRPFVNLSDATNADP